MIAQAQVAAERLFEVELAGLEIAAAAARRPVAERLAAVEAAVGGGTAVGPDILKIGVERRSAPPAIWSDVVSSRVSS